MKRLVQQPMSDAKYARLSDSSSDSSDSDSSDSESESESVDRRQSQARPRMELTEVFTWMTVWVMIIFAVYSSDVRCTSASATVGARCRAQSLCE